jgi:hypothetical protein
VLHDQWQFFDNTVMKHAMLAHVFISIAMSALPQALFLLLWLAADATKAVAGCCCGCKCCFCLLQ